LAAPLRKLPRSSWTRFEAELANQMWRTDLTRYTLANGEHVEILNFLDDHSRYLLACVAFPESAAQRYSPYSATPSPATASRPACYPTTAWSSPPASSARVTAGDEERVAVGLRLDQGGHLLPQREQGGLALLHVGGLGPGAWTARRS